MRRREFLEVMAAAAAAGLALDSPRLLAGDLDDPYDLPPFGNVGLLHITDTHGQLLPVHYREPATNPGVGSARARPPHLVGEALLRQFGLSSGTRAAHAFTHLDFAAAARRYGRTGGFAHLATLLRRLRDQRPGALLLDGGDTWQGSATALWTRGADMVEACLALGVDVMTGHWEFTLGAERVRELVEGPMAGRLEFVAQNVVTADFGDPVFAPFALRQVGGVAVAVLGQAFPYTPVANPRHLVPDWTFGIREEGLRAAVAGARRAGAAVVVLLSHNGVDTDLKLAGRVAGLDAILGGHTHDALPVAVEVPSPGGGTTLVTNAGSNGKFVGVLDLQVSGGRVTGHRYHLLPVFADLLPPDPAMATVVERLRAPFAARLAEPLAVTEGPLYRRGTFNGSFDQVILRALLAVKDAEIALSPGFRWGTSLLPGDTLTREHLMAQTAITYPHVTVTEMTGATLHAVLEDVADNLFHPDPYAQQGGDMVRTAGLRYTCAPHAPRGQRIRHLSHRGEPLDPQRRYRVAGWAPVAEGARGEPVWEVVETWLRANPVLGALQPDWPQVEGVEGDPGWAAD